MPLQEVLGCYLKSYVAPGRVLLRGRFDGEEIVARAESGERQIDGIVRKPSGLAAGRHQGCRVVHDVSRRHVDDSHADLHWKERALASLIDAEECRHARGWRERAPGSRDDG